NGCRARSRVRSCGMLRLDGRSLDFFGPLGLRRPMLAEPAHRVLVGGVPDSAAVLKTEEAFPVFGRARRHGGKRKALGLAITSRQVEEGVFALDHAPHNTGIFPPVNGSFPE